MAAPYAIFVDDYRQPRRDDGINWVRCQTVDQMLETLGDCGAPALVSFDFDLSGSENHLTGMDALLAFLDRLEQMPGRGGEVEVRFHSSDLRKRHQMRVKLGECQEELTRSGWSVHCSDPTEMMDKILGL